MSSMSLYCKDRLLFTMCLPLYNICDTIFLQNLKQDMFKPFAVLVTKITDCKHNQSCEPVSLLNMQLYACFRLTDHN